MIWELKKGYYRTIQAAARVGTKIVKFKIPELVSGAGSVNKLPDIMKEQRIDKVLIIVSRTIVKSGLLEDFFGKLKENNISYEIYDSVKPNPTIENIEDCLKVYKNSNCEAIVAIGGGSPIDCAKVAAARATNSNLQIKDLRGFFKVKKPIPPFFAVPTTAGSGSEVTIAAVVTDSNTHEKYAIADLKLVPDFAILDPELTVGVPQHLTASTGMDALTHAIEAYVGKNGTSYTNDKALKAIKLIIDNLENVYKDGTNIEGRNAMLVASNYAGEAFTRANVGYVHAIAHSIGGLYGVAHGLANAIILPKVLEYYGESVYIKLSEIAIYANLGDKNDDKKNLALKLIGTIKDMNKNMNIPLGIKELRQEDIPLISQRAIKEGNPSYPVPKIMSVNECEELLKNLLL
ncbi:Alcohol dehydrogenase, class IV [Clostridium cavendishii DSM 21758]|uniref:Alcohol dehydrogenase, class IV n=1 Tax=Clostridium cavendishii DSM 21758 TaxID=1121302 RepID=A0A1M6MID6_9CLOT|nr:iron-containing alcohol dehydrogenase [Clostridium cavendishii]SHJ83207.1 Alcohol dehydrogenase, class IV [Clostridium cavendishii DSM 21758]